MKDNSSTNNKLTLNLKVQKIVAREILVFVGTIVIVYVGFSPWNNWKLEWLIESDGLNRILQFLSVTFGLRYLVFLLIWCVKTLRK